MLLSETEDHAGASANWRARYQTLRSRRPHACGKVLCAEPGRSRKRPGVVSGPIPENAS
jgi:hypothetical protein